MAVWETDDEGHQEMSLPTLPAPRETPSRGPSRNSKRSRRSVTPPGKQSKSSSPAPPSTGRSERTAKRLSRDPTTDETISVLDPRRFTPTLHASLVSEILSLRRDQEEKLRQIESLEVALHSAGEARESLEGTTKGVAKENRSLKRQLALLEGGTSSALSELARERDEAVDGVAELKKRLDGAQKKARSQEEDSQRVHEQWAKDRDDWESARRTYERRIHVADTRLVTLLEEFTAYQEAQRGDGTAEGEAAADPAKDDGASVRTMSVCGSGRYSIMNSPPKRAGQKSLADELNFDPFDDTETDQDGRESAFSDRHRRNFSRDSILSRFHQHKHSMSIDSMRRPVSVARGKLLAAALMNPAAVLEAREEYQDETEAETPVPSPTKPPPPSPPPQTPPPPPLCVDAAVQYSPPPSPSFSSKQRKGQAKGQGQGQATSAEPVTVPEKAEPPTRSGDGGEIEANQRRKRVSIAPAPITRPPSVVQKKMVSAAAQTTEALSPPRTPQSPTGPPQCLPGPEEAVRTPVMESVSTQTDRPATPPPKELPPEVPSITIHAPTSRPSSPAAPRLLPQYFKDAAVQVSLGPNQVREIAVQTDEILTERRIALLPAHLQPSSIQSRPVSPEPETPVSPTAGETRHFAPSPGHLPPRNPMRLSGPLRSDDAPRSSTSGSVESAGRVYADENGDDEDDDEPTPRGVDADAADAVDAADAPAQRPYRMSNMFAGLDGHSTDEGEEDFGAEGDLSDSEFRTQLTAPRPKRSSIISNQKRHSLETAGTASPDQVTMRPGPARVSEYVAPEIVAGSFARPGAREALARKKSVNDAVRTSLDRRHSNVQSAGKAAAGPTGWMIQGQQHQQQHVSRAHSPVPGLDPLDPPPFPIPTRASSRNPPVMSASAPSDNGQRSPTYPTYPPAAEGWRRAGRPYRTGSVRKVRSAAAMARHDRPRRRDSRSSPPMSPSTEAPESPGRRPPPPQNDITRSPQTNRDSINGGARYWKPQRAQPSTAYLPASDYAGDEAWGNAPVPPPPPKQPQQQQQQGVGVVESIAQTMIGEWMYKYVRRRKSFGVPDGSRDDSSNDRHKRWVWLAPYERAILWSSKQPTSGGALMGKSGRKLPIQSVLDVKDDNPPPKGAPPLFNRSILILTPQRALKFTAVSSDRHYAWLTALSFLAHSSHAIPEVSALQLPLPPDAPDSDFETPAGSKRRRAGIRDSIRLTKASNLNKALPLIMIPSLPSPGPVPVPPMSEGPVVAPPPSPQPQQVQQQQQQYHDHPYDAAETDTIVPSSPVSEVRMSMSLSIIHDSYPPLYAPSQVSQASQNPPSTARHSRDLSHDAAEAPFIPRFAERASQVLVHGRKRSNTGGHVPPPISFRGFSGPAHAGSVNASAGGGSSSNDSYHHRNPTDSTQGSEMFASSIVAPSSHSWGTGGGGSSSSSHTISNNNNPNATTTTPGGATSFVSSSAHPSEASSRPGSRLLFDAIGTVRMEAFIGPHAATDYHYQHDGGAVTADEMQSRERRRRSTEMRRRRSRDRVRESIGYGRGGASAFGFAGAGSPRRSSNMGMSITTMGSEDFAGGGGGDPFRGF